ncbi:MAG TPA: SPOR domain-containing protein [Sulfurovum sp.]|nr:SPOR domain-containing protein [Sulfurovum sp.]
MNDHNLDDLIIDNLEPKNSKSKSFLTIIALLIVVLIVAIILTKIILKDPNADRLALEDNPTEHISPELTLHNTSQQEEPKAPVATLNVKESIEKIVPPTILKSLVKEEEVEKVAQPTVKITEEFSQEQEKKPEVKVPPKATEPKVTTGSHYIQVGSFSKTPSSRFLSVITNAGFSYKITPASSTGTKKLLIGPYTDRAAASAALEGVKSRINKSAFVIKK